MSAFFAVQKKLFQKGPKKINKLEVDIEIKTGERLHGFGVSVTAETIGTLIYSS